MTARVEHTHLFPGAFIHLSSGGGPLTLRFSDGVEVAAEFLGDSLAVEAYTTAAGAAIPAKVWAVKDRTPQLVRLGARLPA
ncbi:hypothetical protein AB0F81_41580 [Actinoplanes sp. NPDC024001]|uniref:hypothetical protein n=1 Tax=Actinoplanes sp. NPDC024001 TaxID=3154598 RepID=UPI0033F1CA35